MSEKDYTCDIRDLSTERMYVSFVKNYADDFLPLHASRNINALKDGLLSKIGTYYEEDLILRLRSCCRSKDAEIQKLQAENEKLRKCVEVYCIDRRRLFQELTRLNDIICDKPYFDLTTKVVIDEYVYVGKIVTDLLKERGE